MSDDAPKSQINLMTFLAVGIHVRGESLYVRTCVVYDLQGHVLPPIPRLDWFNLLQSLANWPLTTCFSMIFVSANRA